MLSKVTAGTSRLGSARRCTASLMEPRRREEFSPLTGLLDCVVAQVRWGWRRRQTNLASDLIAPRFPLRVVFSGLMEDVVGISRRS